MKIENPVKRPLKAYAFDPSAGRLLGNEMSMAVRFQELDPGPVVRDQWAPNAIANRRSMGGRDREVFDSNAILEDISIRYVEVNFI